MWLSSRERVCRGRRGLTSSLLRRGAARRGGQPRSPTAGMPEATAHSDAHSLRPGPAHFSRRVCRPRRPAPVPTLSHGATELRDVRAVGLKPRAKPYIGVVPGTEGGLSEGETNPFIFISCPRVPVFPPDEFPAWISPCEGGTLVATGYRRENYNTSDRRLKPV